jgi:hypothetical protein
MCEEIQAEHSQQKERDRMAEIPESTD